MYCKHCSESISRNDITHNCTKKGLLNIDEDDSFLVSAIIGSVTDSALLGGDMLGGILGDVLDGDLFD